MLRKLLSYAPRPTLLLDPSASLSPCPPAVFSHFAPNLQGFWATDSLLCLCIAKPTLWLGLPGNIDQYCKRQRSITVVRAAVSASVAFLTAEGKPQQIFLPTPVCLQLLLTKESLLDLEAVCPRDISVSHTLKPKQLTIPLSLLRERVR